MKFIFIRNDDVDKLNKNLEKFLGICLKYEIPIVFGVIPKKVRKETIKLLNRMKKNYPDLITIAQHGWSHKNYSPKPENKYEFGPLRSYEQQKKDILKGKKVMEKNFKKGFSPIFIPPYHGYDENTLKIINEEGFKIFSSGEKTDYKQAKFIDLPVKISLNKYNHKTSKTITLKEMLKKIVKILNSRQKFWGILIHHSDIDDFTKIDKLFRLLKKYEKMKKIKLISLSKLLINYEKKNIRNS